MSVKSFPELVGKDVDEAVSEIQNRCSEYKVNKLPEGSIVTMDYREDRVRVFYNKDNKVSGAPKIG